MSRRVLGVVAYVAVLAPAAAALRHDCGHRGEHQHQHALPWQVAGPGGAAPAGTELVTPEFFSHVCVIGAIDPPAGWVTADSHTHHEECGQIFPEDRLYFDSGCLAEQFMAPRDVEIASPLLWATQNLDNIPWSVPGVTLIGGDCIQAGDPHLVFRREWEGYMNDVGLPVPGLRDGLSGLAESYVVDYLPYGVPARERVLQDGIEISGWSASAWGHLGALNVTGALGGDLFDRYAALSGLTGCAPLYDGNAAATPDLVDPYPFETMVEHFECGVAAPAPVLLGHKNDGTGNWSVPMFQIFERDADAITGYMHQLWPIDTAVDDSDYGPGVGWDWFTHLGAAYAADEIQCFPTDMRAAFPDNFESGNTVWPLLAGPDVAMGYVDYLEAYDLELRDWKPMTLPTTYACTSGAVVACGEEDHHTTPQDAWYGMYYKLLSAGFRPGISAGSDGTCDTQCAPQTYVNVGDTTGLGPSEIYDRYVDSIAAGRTSLSTEGYHYLDLRIDGVEVGDRLELSGRGSVEALVTYELDAALLDPGNDAYFFDPASTYFTDDDRTLELVQDGTVFAAKTLVPSDFIGGVARLTIPGVPVGKSSWFAARSRSTSVHTAATTVIVDDEPIANCLDAEYWMIYCDYVQHKIDAYSACQFQIDWLGSQVQVPEFVEQHVGCSQNDVEKHLARARKVFRSVRDFAAGDPAGVCRHGDKLSPSCGEPMAMVVGGDLSTTPGVEMRLSCVNAPPDTVGLLLLGADLGGNVIVPGASPPYFLPNLPSFVMTTNHGGHAEIAATFANGYPTTGTLYAQWVWINPPGCDADGPLSWTRAVSITLDPASPYASCP